MIRMRHPLHGFHHANGSEEVEMRKHGWVEDVQEAPAKAPEQAVELQKPDRPTLIAQAVGKGIKIDQRWSNDRLAAEIEKV